MTRRSATQRCGGAAAAGLIALGAIGLLGGAPGCASDTPRVSGFALGGTRVVSVGDEIEIRMPTRESGARMWRVSSYDSLYLGLADAPRTEVGRNEKPEVVIRAVARRAGETALELTEVAPQRDAPRIATFNIRILE